MALAARALHANRADLVASALHIVLAVFAAQDVLFSNGMDMAHKPMAAASNGPVRNGAGRGQAQDIVQRPK